MPTSANFAMIRARTCPASKNRRTVPRHWCVSNPLLYEPFFSFPVSNDFGFKGLSRFHHCKFLCLPKRVEKPDRIGDTRFSKWFIQKTSNWFNRTLLIFAYFGLLAFHFLIFRFPRNSKHLQPCTCFYQKGLESPIDLETPKFQKIFIKRSIVFRKYVWLNRMLLMCSYFGLLNLFTCSILQISKFPGIHNLKLSFHECPEIS